ncbi:ABC transporter permease [Photobacterium sp. BZF1]|nr:ABC transporter permease [Photobacterium sp. BZF1]MBC7004092.1 ABC transporter permease [Photobacterium sp. BZF1]
MNKLMKKIDKQAVLGISLMMPAMAILLCFVAYPVFSSFVTSLSDGAGGYSFDTYISLLTDSNVQTNIRYTVSIVLWTVALTILFALILSVYLRFSSSKNAFWIGKIILLPKFVPGVIAVFAFMSVIRNGGGLTRISYQITGERFLPQLLHTDTGIIIMNLWFNIPFATLLLMSALYKISNNQIDSGRDIGLKNLDILFKIVIPHIKNTIYLAATFVFISTMGAFTTPFLMGENAVKMLGVNLFQEFSVYQDYSRAAALSVIIFAISSVVGALYIRIMFNDKKSTFS